jgi:putative transposase
LILATGLESMAPINGSIHDKLSNGNPYKMLTVLDEYAREALAVTVERKMTCEEVLESLYSLLLKRGKPEHIRSDNVLCWEEFAV